MQEGTRLDERDSAGYVPESFLRTMFYSLALAIACAPVTLFLLTLLFFLICALGIEPVLDDWWGSLIVVAYAAFGFAFGYLYRCRFTMLPVVLGWGIFCAVFAWINSPLPTWLSHRPIDARIIYLSWVAAIPFSAILGTAVGRSLKQNQDRARAVFFAFAVAAFAVYYRIALPVVTLE